MIQLTRLLMNRTAPVFLNPALIEFVRAPVREDRSGRPVVEDGSELGTVSGERMRILEAPEEVARLVAARPMMHAG